MLGISRSYFYYQPNEALLKFGKPKIFHTNQGSQHTSYFHSQTLDQPMAVYFDSLKLPNGKLLKKAI